MKDYDKVLTTARNAFASGKTKCLGFRRQQLKNMLRLLLENEKELLDALHMDLRKSSFEGKLGESENLKNEVKVMIRDLEKFAADEKLPLNLIAFLDSGYVRREPYGVVLILGTWNYPFNLSLQPLVGALAAGNCVVLKPSEVAPHSAATMAKLLPKYIDSECYQVVLGGVEETQQLLVQKFDYIFYTGSFSVGRIVATAAAQHVTPVTLELGGKSPCYIDNDADFRLAAKRILWGKVMNLGMTCIAPDYVLCGKEVEAAFVKVAHDVLHEWYGESLQKCSDLPRIPNKNHFNRLKKMLEGTKGKIAYGGESDEDDLWISPTIVVGVNETDILMAPENEIFGPILPILTVDNIDEAVQFINARPKPLAAYIFSRSSAQQRKFINETSSGGACVNDVIWHNIWPNLPFGGVGASGYGNYHGKFSFDTFSHKRAVLVRGFSYFSEKLGERRYPPYTNEKLLFFTFIIKYFDACSVNIQNINSGHFLAASLGALFVLLLFYFFSAIMM